MRKKYHHHLKLIWCTEKLNVKTLKKKKTENISLKQLINTNT